MENQIVQTLKNKIDLTFNKFVIKVERDFNQAQFQVSLDFPKPVAQDQMLSSRRLRAIDLSSPLTWKTPR